MVRFMKGNGSWIRLMVMAHIFIRTVQLTKGIGRKICNREKELINGQMDHFSKVLTKKGRSMVLASSSGLMGQHMKVISMRIILKGKENILGLTDVAMKAIGLTIKGLKQFL
jgi:hypothetical protein